MPMINRTSGNNDIGTAGLWTWPFTFPMCCSIAINLIWNVSASALIGSSAKLYLVHFNILNGIWSITHLYQLNLDDNNEVVMTVFVIFFVLQALFNVMLVMFSYYYYGKAKIELVIAKHVIAFIFEIPMLACQMYAMKKHEKSGME